MPLAFAWTAAALFAASLLFFVYSYLFLYGAAPRTGGVLAPALINVGLFSVFALHHSLFARAGVKRAVRQRLPAIERSLYTAVASLLFIGVCWGWRPVPGVLYELQDGWRWIAYAVFGCGVAVTLLGARRLDVLELAGVRQAQPREAAPAGSALVTSGLYGFVRHPVYFGWVLLVFGVPQMSMTRFVFAATSTLYLALAIPFEERSLIETFGSDYASYQQKVRWRMLPGLY